MEGGCIMGSTLLCNVNMSGDANIKLTLLVREDSILYDWKDCEQN
jgi:hypothetical protein